MTGKRIGVFGLARSGVPVARAAQAQGGMPTVVDEARGNAKASAELRGLGIQVLTDWTESFDRESFDLIVTSPGVRKDHPKLQDAVRKGIEIWSEVEFAYRISKAPIVAITGTNGKSTTTVMTYLCLKESGMDAVLCGNISGTGYEEVSLTEAAHKSSQDQVLVAEISSFQLEWVHRFKPFVAGITNISQDHLNRYSDFEDYAATKHRIFSKMGVDDIAVINRADPNVREPEGPQVLSFGTPSSDAEVLPDSLKLMDMSVPLVDLEFEGRHNYDNACMAALLAYGALRCTADTGMPDSIVVGLRRFKGIRHRMERLDGERGGVRVINNSMCTNPAAVVASAQSVKGTKHLLLGGTNKQLDFAPLKSYLRASKDKAYIFGKDSADLNAQLGGGLPIFETMQGAFRAATLAAKTGEVIMLAPGCMSTDQFQDFSDRGNVFNSIAKEWLKSGETQG